MRFLLGLSLLLGSLWNCQAATPVGAANWKANSTTNSTLRGIGSANELIGTNAITLNGDRRTAWPTNSLPNTGTAGTYRSVTTDAQGRVTAGTVPTTFSGYAISDTGANFFSAISSGKQGTGVPVFDTSPTISTKLTLTGATETSSNPVLDVTQTWNSLGVTFTGLKLNITDTASALASLLMDLQVGGVSKLTVTKGGNVLAGPGALITPSISFFGDPDTGFWNQAANRIGLSTAGSLDLLFISGEARMKATELLSWSSGDPSAAGSDTVLLRDAANTLALRNAVNAQTNRIYGTFSTTADYVRLAQWANSTTVNIAAETAGTGADNIPINITPAGTSGVVIGGVTDASAAAAGKVGEVISSSIAVGSAVSLTTATAANVTSISLTAGDWRVSGNVNFAATSATVTGTSGGITVTSATVPTDGTEVYSGVQVTLLSETDSVTIPDKQVNVNATTTVYLVGKSTFSAGSVAAFGSISARRLR